MAGHCLVLQSWVRRPGRSSSNLLVLLLLLLHLLLLLLPGIDFTQPSQLRSHDHSCPLIHTCTSFCSILAVELSSPSYCTWCLLLSSYQVQPSLPCLVVHFTKTNSLIIWRLGLCLSGWWRCAHTKVVVIVADVGDDVEENVGDPEFCDSWQLGHGMATAFSHILWPMWIVSDIS